MKKTIILLVFLLITSIYPQSFYIKSNKISLNIKFPPPDTVYPTLAVSLPQRLEGFPVYCRDTIYTLIANIFDNSNKVLLKINDEQRGYFSNGTIKVDIPIHYGENKIKVEVLDRQLNNAVTEFVVFQDEDADITAPIIKLISPNLSHTRGLTVVKRNEMNDTIIVVGEISDQSELLGVWINNEKADSIVNGTFYYNFGDRIPDSIIIKAADTYGNLSLVSAKVMTDVTISNNNSLEIGKYYALLIGVEEYRDININDLMFPLDDCEKVYDVLVSDYIFEPENVRILKNPTREEIIRNFQTLRNTLTDQDNLLIFYAGHGYKDNDIDQGYWLPSDAGEDPTNWLSNSLVRDYIKGIKSKHTLLISDACFSGAIFNTREAFINLTPSVAEIYKYKSRRAITSGAENVVPDKSVFVEYLVKRLKENTKRFLTAQELYISFKDAVINNSRTNQSPQYGIIQNAEDEDLGDFIFIKR